MRVPQLGDWTPSDVGPWKTVVDKRTGESHVVPGFGPKHKLSMGCWCHPVADVTYDDAVVVHNVAH